MFADSFFSDEDVEEEGGIVGPGGPSTAVVATGRPCGSGGVSQGGPTSAQSSAESWVGADFL